MYVTHYFQKMTNRKMCVRWCKETNGKTTALVGTPSAKWQRKCQKSVFSSGNRPHSANSNWLAEGGLARGKMLDVHSLLAFRQLLALAERGDVREGEAPAEPGLFSFWWLGGSPAAFGKKTRRSEIWLSLRRAS